MVFRSGPRNTLACPTWVELASISGPRKQSQAAFASAVFVHSGQHSEAPYVTALRGWTFLGCLRCSDQVKFQLALSAVHVAHKPFLEIAPNLIAIFRLDYGLSRSAEGQEIKTKHYYVMESVGIAAGILLTALHMAGLATSTHTPSPMGLLDKILNRPKNEKPYLLIPCPSADAAVPRITKKPRAEVLEVVS